MNAHDDDMGPKSLHQFQRFGAVRCFADHADLGIEPKQFAESRPFRH
jgi:hypothetical protein